MKLIRKFLKMILPPIITLCLKGGELRAKELLYQYEMNKRKKLSIFAIDELTADPSLHYFPWMPYLNIDYGHGYILKNFLKDKGIKDCAIQHGLHYIGPLGKDLTDADTIIAFSELYKNYLLELMPWKKVVVAGLYINYAKSLLTENELKELKSKLGKTLLIMPGHTTVSIDTKYNIDSFIDDIEKTKIKYNFDTVLVCVYWTDYQKGRAQKFIDKGYKLCSAGHIYDRYFLNRLRSIISLADVVMSNLIGTNLGYAIALNKPYYLKLSKSVEIKGNDEWGAYVLKNGASILDIDAKQNKKAAEYFGEYREEITKEQRAFVEKYWGK